MFIRKIDAIKEVRAQFGCQSKEAKDLVDSIERFTGDPPPPSIDPNYDERRTVALESIAKSLSVIARTN